MEEDEDYQGPKEDCVEECKWTLLMIYYPASADRLAVELEGFVIIQTLTTDIGFLCSLPPHPLCHPVCRAQALQGSQISDYRIPAMLFSLCLRTRYPLSDENDLTWT